MHNSTIWARVLGVEGAVVETVRIENDDEEEVALVFRVRARYDETERCSACHRPCSRYDSGSGMRRWRSLDLGTLRAFVEAEGVRVSCPEHGVVAAHAPWARRGSRFTRDFEDTVSWLATHTDRTTLCELLRIAWRSVGRIIERVGNEAKARAPRLAGVRRIGIDEVSYRRGHRYLTIVVDHDSGRLLWAGPGHDETVLQRFFDELGDAGCAAIEVVSADAAAWIENAVRARCPRATLCMDPFHVVQWATNAVDVVRREIWNRLRKINEPEVASAIKGMRFVLLKNPEKLNPQQRERLSVVADLNGPLYRAYLLKEQLRAVFKRKGDDGVRLLDAWLAWASRSKLSVFVEVARSVRRHKEAIVAALTNGISNARVEAMNTRFQLLNRLAFGFHSPAPLIALAMMRMGGMRPHLPGRVTH